MQTHSGLTCRPGAAERLPRTACVPLQGSGIERLDAHILPAVLPRQFFSHRHNQDAMGSSLCKSRESEGGNRCIISRISYSEPVADGRLLAGSGSSTSEAGTAGKRFHVRAALGLWPGRHEAPTAPCRTWVETLRLRRQPLHQCSLGVPAT
jgi:hypothetical protein